MLQVHSFESLAAVDGEGVRFAVFLSGCPLQCLYCHNPDARRFGGTPYREEDVAKKIARYAPYFGEKGGATFTGGEPLLQAGGILRVASLLPAVPYVLDTSGVVPLSGDVKEALLKAQLIICDVKAPGAASFRRIAGEGFDNLKATLAFLREHGKRVWLRTVIVPGLNDTAEDICRLAAFAKPYRFEKYELLAFHTLGFFKYEQLGEKNPLSSTPPLSGEKLAKLQEKLDSLISNEQ